MAGQDNGTIVVKVGVVRCSYKDSHVEFVSPAERKLRNQEQPKMFFKKQINKQKGENWKEWKKWWEKVRERVKEIRRKSEKEIRRKRWERKREKQREG